MKKKAKKVRQLPKVTVPAKVEVLPPVVPRVLHDEEEPVEWAVVGAVCTLAVVFLLVFGVVAWVVHLHTLAPFSKACQANPRELYGQTCDGKEDCLTKCIDRLRSVKPSGAA